MEQVGLTEFRRVVSVQKLKEWLSNGGVEIVADGEVVAAVVVSSKDKELLQIEANGW